MRGGLWCSERCSLNFILYRSQMQPFIVISVKTNQNLYKKELVMLKNISETSVGVLQPTVGK